MNESSRGSREGWRSAWPDLLAFAVGLAMAWGFQWRTTDLVWSLWLSSLVVGFATLAWGISEPLRDFIGGIARDQSSDRAIGAKLAAGGLILAGSLFALAFFTVHFGGFHFVHSVFLNAFLPLDPAAPRTGLTSSALYVEVVKNYWMFLPVAFLAERSSFQTPPADAADTAVTPQAIARRKARAMSGAMMSPYKNVIRLHLLIFFFAAAHFLRWENFAVYAVVYAVYFFPWNLWRRRTPRDQARAA